MDEGEERRAREEGRDQGRLRACPKCRYAMIVQRIRGVAGVREHGHARRLHGGGRKRGGLRGGSGGVQGEEGGGSLGRVIEGGGKRVECRERRVRGELQGWGNYYLRA